MIRQIVVGIDFSDAARHALARASAWASRLGVPLKAIHVIHLARPLLEEAYPVLYQTHWTRELEQTAREQLSTWMEGVPEATSHIVFGSPAEELVAACDPESLLVVGQVGHSAIEHLLFGSTAARVVRHAPCDVLVVRQAPVATQKGEQP